MPGGYETPRRVPLLDRMFFGDPAPNGQEASVRRRSASTAPPSVGMQSREEARHRTVCPHEEAASSRLPVPGVGTISHPKARGESYDD